MKVTSAEFIGAATEPGRFPPATLPEVAFAGRSNVGKSSALNRLLGRRKLARTSATPGRTQQLNFFRVNDALIIVDLPGFGYARASQAARASWRPLVESYLTTRGTLVGVVLLVDIRRGLESEEHQLIDFLAAYAVPYVVVATKVDKLGRSARPRALAALGRTVPVAGTGIAPPTVPFSAVTGEGVGELWHEIAAWMRAPNASRTPGAHA